ncbi:MAG: hypothetical protein R3Y43_00250 [Alphaproteobacteria bacterium]
MAKQTVKSSDNLCGAYAFKKIMDEAKKNGLSAVGTIQARFTRFADSSNKQKICWRLKLSNGSYGFFDIETGKTKICLRKDVLSSEKVGNSLELNKQIYTLKEFEGKMPFYYR